MLYRVFALALLCGAPIAAWGATMAPRETSADADAPVLASLSGSLLAEPPVGPAWNDPLDPKHGNLMWDPLGWGCIDVAEPVAWLPGGARDPEAGVLCLPQPCLRLLTTEEMEREVLGRPLREGEWDIYLARYAEACSSAVMWRENEADGDRLLQDAFLWTALDGPGSSRVPGGLARVTDGATIAERRFSPALASSGLWSGGASQGRDGIFPDVQPGRKTDPLPQPPAGRLQSDAPLPSGDGAGPGATPGGADLVGGDNTRQPAPVPLPGSLMLLAAAVAALRLPRR